MEKKQTIKRLDTDIFECDDLEDEFGGLEQDDDILNFDDEKKEAELPKSSKDRNSAPNQQDQSFDDGKSYSISSNSEKGDTNEE